MRALVAVASPAGWSLPSTFKSLFGDQEELTRSCLLGFIGVQSLEMGVVKSGKAGLRRCIGTCSTAEMPRSFWACSNLASNVSGLPNLSCLPSDQCL